MEIIPVMPFDCSRQSRKEAPQLPSPMWEWPWIVLDKCQYFISSYLHTSYYVVFEQNIGNSNHIYIYNKCCSFVVFSYPVNHSLEAWNNIHLPSKMHWATIRELPVLWDWKKNKLKQSLCRILSQNRHLKTLGLYIYIIYMHIDIYIYVCVYICIYIIYIYIYIPVQQ